MASNVHFEETENYFRLVSLLLDVGSTVVRKLVLKHTGGTASTLHHHLWNYNGILANLSHKGILHQPQMDLLFPPGGGMPDIEKFDITLLSCLLQKTCFGTLSQQETQLITDLKTQRNEIFAHIEKSSVEESAYQKSWKDITTTITNLLQTLSDPVLSVSIRNRITTLRHNPPLQRPSFSVLNDWYRSDQELMSLVKDMHADLEAQGKDIQSTLDSSILSGLQDIHGQLEELRQNQGKYVNQPDPALDRLQKSSEQFLLSRARPSYVQTKQMDQVLERLQKGSCVISGKPGEGKTLAGASIIKNNFDIKKCLVLSHPKQWETVDVKQAEAIFIDDIFGIFQLDEDILRKWLRVLDNIDASCGAEEGKLKVIIATRANILKECVYKVSRFKLFKNVVEFSSSKLLEEEKKMILTSTLQHHNKSLNDTQLGRCIREFSSPIGFPICCQLFSTNASLFKLREGFFKKPLKFFKVNVSTLEEVSFISLVFLLYRQGAVRLSELTAHNERHCSELKCISTSLGSQQVLLPTTVKRQFEQMRDVYVTVQQGSVTFVHNTVYETISLMYGKTNPEEILRVCSSDFLHQCVTLQDASENGYDVEQEEEDQVLAIHEDYQPRLAERLINDIVERGEVERTATHTALRDQPFLSHFVQTLQRRKLQEALCIKNRGTFYQQPFLSHYLKVIFNLKNVVTCRYLSIVLESLGKCKHPMSHSREECLRCETRYDCMNVCSKYGNVAAFMLLVEYGASPDRETMYRAAQGDSMEIAMIILRKGVVPDAETLTCFVRRGKFSIALEAMECGAKPDTNTLDHAIKADNIDVVRAVIRHGAQPSACAVKYAVEKGKLELVKMLLQCGASSDNQAVEIAIQAGRFDILVALLDHGTLPDTSSLKYAVQEQNFDVVRELLGHGAKPDMDTLEMAIQGDNWDVLMSVLKHVDVMDEETRWYSYGTQYQHIIMRCSGNLAVLSSSARENERQKLLSSVQAAVVEKDVNTIKALVEHGPVFDKETLDIAVQTGNYNIARMVLKYSTAVPDTKTLRSAVTTGNIDIVNLVSERGTVPDRETLKEALSQVRSTRTVTTGYKKFTFEVITGRQGNVNIIKKVLDLGAVPNTDILNTAVYTCNLDIFRILMEHGAVPDSTTLDAAVEKRKSDILKEIIGHGVLPVTDHLNRAVCGNSTDITRILLKHGALPDTKTLQWATERNNVDVVRLALENGVVPDADTLDVAVRMGYIGVVRLLLKHGAPLGKMTVYKATRGENLDIVRLVLENGGIPNTDALHTAVQRGKVEFANLLLENGAVPNTGILGVAAAGGNINIFRLLLKHGAPLGTTTVNKAIIGGNLDIVRLVLENGGIPNTDALHKAVQGGQVQFANLLLENGAVPDTDILGVAAAGGNINIVRLLLKHGAPLGTTTVNKAITGGNLDIVRLVLENGGVPNTDALHKAVQGGKVEFANLLLENGAVPDTDILGVAAAGGNINIVRLLLKHGAPLGTTTVNKAMISGNLDIVRLVLENGGVPNADVLHKAVHEGKFDIVNLVLEKGLVPNMASVNMVVMNRNSKIEIVNAVLDHGSKPDTVTLNFAVRRGKVDIVRAVLKYGAVPDSCTIHCAVLGRNLEIVSSVLGHGALPGKRTLNFARRIKDIELLRVLEES